MLGFVLPVLGMRQGRFPNHRQTILCSRPEKPAVQSSKTNLSSKSLVSVPRVVFVLGGPGSGKGTQCERLQRDFDFKQLCVGDLLRREAARDSPLGATVARTMQRGEIVPGEVTIALLKDELAALSGKYEGVLIDGFPRAMDQAVTFEEVIAACQLVLFFSCEEKDMIARLLKRAETSGRADDDEQVVKRRLRTFEKKTMPVVEYYRERGLLEEVNSGIGNPDEVYEHTKRVFLQLLLP